MVGKLLVRDRQLRSGDTIDKSGITRKASNFSSAVEFWIENRCFIWCVPDPDTKLSILRHKSSDELTCSSLTSMLLYLKHKELVNWYACEMVTFSHEVEYMLLSPPPLPLACRFDMRDGCAELAQPLDHVTPLTGIIVKVT
eukprot:1358313-Amorphochlora_amoeboformis.AAC.2